MAKIKVFDENLYEFEKWFIINKFVYQYEIKEAQKVVPKNEKGFEIEQTYQTVFGKLDEIKEAQKVLDGYGNGSFVVIKARKSKLIK